MSLTPRQRARRVAILCCHYLRNCAYYYAGLDGNTPKREGEFWRGVSGNCFDLCALEFCKLFGEKRGKHHWRKVIEDEAAFLSGLLVALHMSAAEFNDYIESMKFYRDKYVAHLDDQLGGNYPFLEPGKQAVSYLYDYMLEHEDKSDFFPDATQTAAEFYGIRKEEGEEAYA